VWWCTLRRLRQKDHELEDSPGLHSETLSQETKKKDEELDITPHHPNMEKWSKGV
jgi:hypothetical protein